MEPGSGSGKYVQQVVRNETILPEQCINLHHTSSIPLRRSHCQCLTYGNESVISNRQQHITGCCSTTTTTHPLPSRTVHRKQSIETLKQLSTYFTLILLTAILLHHSHSIDAKSSADDDEQAKSLNRDSAEQTTAQLHFTTQKESTALSRFLQKFTNHPTTTTVEPTFEFTTIATNEDDASAEHDDDDAEGCEGLSADEPAKAANLSDVERLVNLQTCLQRKVKRGLMGATRNGMEMFEKLSLSGGCTSSLLNLMANLGQIKSFAFKFLDASAKIPSGVMYGLLSDFGDFDQCLSIRSDPNIALEQEADEGAYSGKYCLMSVKLNYHVNLKNTSAVPEGIIPDGLLWDELVRNYWTSKSPKGFQVGMCFPSRCTNDDLDQLYRLMAKKYNVIGEIMSCQDSLDLKKQYEANFIQRLIIHSFYIILALTVVGTFIDRYYSESEIMKPTDCSRYSTASSMSVENSVCASGIALIFKILICFSIIKNWKTFLQKQPDKLESLTRANSETLTDECNLSQSTVQKSPNSEQTINCDTTTIESRNSEFVDHKLCQLTVRIQPDDCPETNMNKSLSQLSGLRLIVIIWITIGHSFLYPSANNYQYYRSIINMNITRDSVWFATTNFTLGIDMLLYMTGLGFVYKLAHLSTKTYNANKASIDLKSSSMEVIRFISKRILRFWPTYVTVIAIAIVVPLMSDGPMWPEMVSKRIGASCQRNWWSNLLFINNFFNESEICLPSSWFVSILMQLFVVGSMIIILAQKISLTIALVALSVLLIGSCGISFAFAYIENVRAPMIRMDESFVMEMDEKIFRLYTNIFNNLGPFLVGMLGGFLLIREQLIRTSRENVQASQNKSIFPFKRSISTTLRQKLCRALIASIVLLIAVLVLSSVFHQNYSQFWGSVYWCSHRIGWAIVTGYVIHNCATGRWPLVNDFLSLSTFIPVSRLIPIAYLVYPIFIHIHSGLVRDGLHVSIYNMLNIYTTRLVMTFTTALLIHLLVELPFCSIEEIYLNRWIWQISNSPKKIKRSFHPLLAVAPVINIQFNDIKVEEAKQNPDIEGETETTQIDQSSLDYN